ncbi:MAG: iron-containing alcohol dehydrogenase family protein [Planctomycetota bacterium]|jgi:alcohol dehydrogenase class IV
MAGPLRLNFPGVSHVGPGSVEVLGREASGLGSRALLVTGRSALREAGITDRLIGLLRGAEVDVELFDQVPPEPEVATVDAAREAISRTGCDLVVEAGGGSAMDVGKAAAALAFEEGPAADYHGERRITRPGLPHVAIATTAGTGAEVTRNSVITDPATGLKKSIRGDGLMPTVSITDAELTLSCPPDVTAACGIDALVQAIESFFSLHAISTTEALSLKAAELIARHLGAAFEDGSDMRARAALSEGSYMAGLALGSARLGAAHGLAHPVGLCYGLPHGVVCGVLMPPVLQSNVRPAPEKYEALRPAMGGDPVQILCGLIERLNLPLSLGDHPDKEWERRIVDYALASGSARANPTPVDEDYVRAILEQVCR